MALVFVSGTETENITSDGLNEQLRDHIRYVAIEKSAKLTEEFAALEQGVIGVSKHVLDEAVLEAPLPLDVPSTDYHTVALPDSLTALTARRSQPVSLEHSVYYAPVSRHAHSCSASRRWPSFYLSPCFALSVAFGCFVWRSPRRKRKGRCRRRRCSCETTVCT